MENLKKDCFIELLVEKYIYSCFTVVNFGKFWSIFDDVIKKLLIVHFEVIKKTINSTLKLVYNCKVSCQWLFNHQLRGRGERPLYVVHDKKTS